MKMYDMKKIEMENKQMMNEESEYPHCLKLYLHSEILKKLNFKEIPNINEVIDINAKAIVVAARTDECASIEIQIVSMGAEKTKEKISPLKALYGDDSESESEDMNTEME